MAVMFGAIFIRVKCFSFCLFALSLFLLYHSVLVFFFLLFRARILNPESLGLVICMKFHILERQN